MTRTQTMTRFLLYLAVVVLINIAGLTLFFRVDLTENGLYSLSDASRETVSRLTEPLTIKVFFTKNLPAPYNGIERYLHDLLEEYAVYGGKRFNYTFYDVSPKEGEATEEARANQKLAQDYGITPVQVQNIESDEVKFQKAYMGMVLIHGDLVEKLPAITTTDGLEYKITTTIRKMVNKISALAGLQEPISVTLFLSSSLSRVAPALKLEDPATVRERLEKLVDELNGKYYGKLALKVVDPATDEQAMDAVRKYNLLTLKWPAFTDPVSRQKVPAGSGTAGILVTHGDKARTIPLIVAENIPLFGTRYRLVDVSQLGDTLAEVADSVVDINEKIGYLSDHGTPPLNRFSMSGQQDEALTNFNKLLSETYSISEVSLGDNPIPEGLQTLIIAGPKEKFTDYELFQIDQYLMKGHTLAVFLDPFTEITPQGDNRFQFNQQPMFLPVNSGLEKLLSHYGVTVKNAYVLDKHCYKQRVPRAFGGGENPIYFAPMIRNQDINHDLPYLSTIKGLVTLQAAPIQLQTDTLKQHGITATTLFSSSDKAWEMTGRINLNPMFIQPPVDEKQFARYPLAVLLEGEFPSYFADKPIPAKETGEKAADEKQDKNRKADAVMDKVTGEGLVLKKGKPGRILLIGTSKILGDNVIDEAGASPNATFVLNMIDALNNREATAELRGKVQQFNPLHPASAGVKTTVKVLNIAGLPALVALFGLIVWFRRTARKKRIRQLYAAASREG